MYPGQGSDLALVAQDMVGDSVDEENDLCTFFDDQDYECGSYVCRYE